MKSPLGRCASCAFFAADLQAQPGANHDGYCHADPPRVVVHPDRSGRVVLRATFPPVKGDEWCGAFEVKAEEVQ